MHNIGIIGVRFIVVTGESLMVYETENNRYIQYRGYNQAHRGLSNHE
jgi:hypothetical protein